MKCDLVWFKQEIKTEISQTLKTDQASLVLTLMRSSPMKTSFRTSLRSHDFKQSSRDYFYRYLRKNIMNYKQINNNELSKHLPHGDHRKQLIILLWTFTERRWCKWGAVYTS